MSLELDNIDEQNEKIKPQELEQYGVWVKGDSTANHSGKDDADSEFDKSFDIPSGISTADGFESASFSDLSDFNDLEKNVTDDTNDEEWSFDTSELDIPDPPELSETNEITEEELPLEMAMNENLAQDNIEEQKTEIKEEEVLAEKHEDDTPVSSITEPSVKEETQDPFINDFLPSAASNDLDISDLSDFDFGDDSSFPVPDSLTGQAYVEGMEAEETPQEASNQTDIPESYSEAEEINNENNIEETVAPIDDLSFDIPSDITEEKLPEESSTSVEEAGMTNNADAGYEEISLSELTEEIQTTSAQVEEPATEENNNSSTEDIFKEDLSSIENETFGDIQFEDITASVPIEKPATPKAEEIDEVAEAIFNNTTEEIDIDSFLSDSPAPTMGGTEEISLEDFMSDSDFSDASEFKEFISSTSNEKNDILNDPPIEMALSFDDSFVMETKANPEDDIEQDIPEAQDFISDIVTSGEDEFDNFDDIFDNITDMNAPEEPAPVEIKPESTVVYDEVSDFDDLLNSFEDTPSSSEATVIEHPAKPDKKRDFDIQVNLDESEIKHETIETPDDSEEDVAVSLYTDTATSTNDKNDSQLTSSSFSMDDLDGSISFVDETPESPASSLIDDLSFAGIEVVDITDNPGNSVENNTEKPEETESKDSTIETEPLPSSDSNDSDSATDGIPVTTATEDLTSPSAGFGFPEVDEELFEKAMSVASEPEHISTTASDIPEDEPSSGMTFDELPDIDDIFDSAEQDNSKNDELPSLDDIPDYFDKEANNTAAAAVTAGVIGAGLVAAKELTETEDDNIATKDEVPAADFDIPTDDFSFTDAAIEEPSTDEVQKAEEAPVEEPVMDESISEEAPVEEPVMDESFAGEAPTDEVPLTTDDFNFPETAEEPLTDETPAAEIDIPNDDFSFTEAAIEEPSAEEAPVEEPVMDETIPEEAPTEEVPLTTDDFNFPETAEEPVVDETPAAEIDIPNDDFSFTEAAIEEPSTDEVPKAEEAPVEEPVMDESFAEEVPFEEPVMDESTAEESPTEEAPVEEPVMDATIHEEAPTDEVPLTTDDFNFPETAEEPVVDETPAAEIDIPTDDFSFTEAAIEEPSTDEASVEEPSAEETSIKEPVMDESIPEEASADEVPLTTDDFNFPETAEEPLVDETPAAEIDIPNDDFSFTDAAIEEPSTDDVPVEEPVMDESIAGEAPTEEAPVEEPVMDTTIPEESPTEEVPLTTDDFNFPETAEEPLVEETPAAEIDIPTDDFSFTEAAIEEPSTDEVPVEETVMDESFTEEPPVEEPVMDATIPEEAPTEEVPLTTDDFNFPKTAEEPLTDETPAAEIDIPTDDFSFTEAAVEEPSADEVPKAEEAPVEEPVMDESIAEEAPTEEVPLTTDDFNFPETAEEPVVDETPAAEIDIPNDDFSFTEASIEEPSADEVQKAEEAPVEEPFIDESISEEAPTDEAPLTTDDFNFPETAEEPVVDETPAAEIDIPNDDFSFTEAAIEEPTTDEAPFEEPVMDESIAGEAPTEEVPLTTEDFNFPETAEETVVDETPAAEIDIPNDDFSFTDAAIEESSTEEAPAEEPVMDESFAEEVPVEEPVMDESFTGEVPAEEPINSESSDSTDFDALPLAGAVTATTAAAALLNSSADETPLDNELNATNELDVVEKCIYNETGDMEVVSDMNDFDINKDSTLENSTENPVIDKIVDELSALRNEMASIKAELNSLKNTETNHNSVSNEITLPETGSNESTGFFSGDEDDETIALSGDELNNILNSADFTEETVEPVTPDDTPLSPEGDIASQPEEAQEDIPQQEDSLAYDDGDGPDTSIDFDENVSEPVIDNINFDIEPEENTAPSELPEDIDIPSNDDAFVVDASSSDFFDDKDPTLDEALSSDKVSYLNEESSDNVTFDEANEAPDQTDGYVPITQDELTSTMEDSSLQDEVDAEEEIDDTPAETVFDSEQWEKEQELSEQQENADIPAEIPEEATLDTSDEVSAMPDSLKNDVKSVLAYMDQLLENLPEEKIAEFARSEHFEVYKKLFTELGLA